MDSTVDVTAPRGVNRWLFLLLGVFAAGSTLLAHSLQGPGAKVEATVTVRYVVKDVADSVDFYTKQLGFSIALDSRPGFALVARGPLRLALSGATGQGGGAQSMSDGRKPEPGGWNRIQITVDDLEREVARLRAAGVHFRSEVVRGYGGSQVLLDDPSGNPIELFQPH